jgi:antirestriction protein ArdC
MLIGDYKTPYFATLRQINEAGGRVKKGTKATSVYFRDVIYKDKSGRKLKPEEGAARVKAGDKSVSKYSFIRIHPVFNMQDVEGMPIKPVTPVGNADNQPLDICQDFLAGLQPAPIIQTVVGEGAFFSRKTDKIVMPPLDHFTSTEHYYKVLFHELTHWTGAEKRLNRPTLTDFAKFGDPLYSKEELTAELGACFLCNRMGILPSQLVDHAATYIDHWLTVLKKNKTFVWEASIDAQAAYSFLLPA